MMTNASKNRLPINLGKALAAFGAWQVHNQTQKTPNWRRDTPRQAATKEFEQEHTEKTEKEKLCQKCGVLENSTAKAQRGQPQPNSPWPENRAEAQSAQREKNLPEMRSAGAETAGKTFFLFFPPRSPRLR